MDKLTYKLKVLNMAYKLIQDSLKLVEHQFPGDDDINTHIWRIKKNCEELHKSIMRNLDIQINDEKFKDIIEGFDINDT